MDADSDINFEPDRVLMFDCPLCKYYTTYFSRLSEHAIEHPEKDIEFIVYQCGECNVYCSSEDLLQEHAEIHHPERGPGCVKKVEELFLNCRTASDAEGADEEIETVDNDNGASATRVSIGGGGGDEEDLLEDDAASRGGAGGGGGAGGTDFTKDEDFTARSWATNVDKRAWASEKNPQQQQQQSKQQQHSRKRQFGGSGPSHFQQQQQQFNRRPIGGPHQPMFGAQKRPRPNWSQGARVGRGVGPPGGGGGGGVGGPPDLVIRDKGDYVISVSRFGLEARLRFDPAFYSSDAASQTLNSLATELAWQQLKTKRPGGQGESAEPRMTYWVGPAYSYGSVRLPENNNWHETLARVKQDVERAIGGKAAFNACLAILYRDNNDSMPWHSDNEREMGANPAIASVSFGATRLFELRRKEASLPPPGPVFGQQVPAAQGFHCVHVPLGSGTLLYSSGSIQQDWQHRIGKQAAGCGVRINLTFRWISTGGGGGSGGGGGKWKRAGGK